MKNIENKNELSVEEKWESLTFANNFLFCKIMESEPEICRRILELLLHIKIERLEQPQAERTMQEGLDSKSVRFDVYVKDENRVFDIEMQTATKHNLRKRARYYQSMIDMDCLMHGENYRRLKESYVIFLCLSDMFGKDLPAYKFENICVQDKDIKLNDGAYKIFFNAAKYDKIKNKDEKAFFKFLLGKSADNDLTQRIAEKVSRAKKNAAWRKQYMTWEQEMEDLRQESFDEGLEIGARKNAIDATTNLLRMNLGTPEQIAQASGLPLEEVIILRNSLSAQVAVE